MALPVTHRDLEYHYAGHVLRTSFPCIELAEAHASTQIAFRVSLCSGPPEADGVLWVHDFPNAFGESTLKCERSHTGFRLHFPSVATVVASPRGDVVVHPHAAASMDAVRHVLLDQALPRLLAQRGEMVLHGAVVGTRAGKTLLLIGDSGRGKSTLTGAFFASGRSVGTDDGALIRVRDGVVFAYPTYPSLRLLPDSRAHLFAGVDSATLPVAGYGDKRRLPVAGAIGGARVDSIVLLDPPLEDGAAPVLFLESPGQACMAMIRHGFQLDLSDTANLQVLLAKAAEVTRLTSVHRLAYPRRYEALPDVIALLEAEL